jgi:hypothetical protein
METAKSVALVGHLKHGIYLCGSFEVEFNHPLPPDDDQKAIRENQSAFINAVERAQAIERNMRDHAEALGLSVEPFLPKAAAVVGLGNAQLVWYRDYRGATVEQLTEAKLIEKQALRVEHYQAAVAKELAKPAPKAKEPKEPKFVDLVKGVRAKGTSNGTAKAGAPRSSGSQLFRFIAERQETWAKITEKQGQQGVIARTMIAEDAVTGKGHGLTLTQLVELTEGKLVCNQPPDRAIYFYINEWAKAGLLERRDNTAVAAPAPTVEQAYTEENKEGFSKLSETIAADAKKAKASKNKKKA